MPVIAKQDKKWTILSLLVCFCILSLIYFTPTEARADTAHPQCDYTTDPTGGGNWSGQLIGCITLGENLTLYSYEIYIGSNSGTTYPSVQLNGVEQVQTTPTPSGTGYKTIVLDTPITATSGSSLLIGGFSTSNSSYVNAGSAVQIRGNPYTTYNNIYRVFNFTAPDYSSRIDSITYATSTNEVTISGYWNTNYPESYNSDELYIFQSDLLGVTNQEFVTATSSGPFTYVYQYNGIQTASSSLQFAYDINVTSRLSRLDERYFDPFGTEGLDPTNSLYKTLIQEETITIGAEAYDGTHLVKNIEGVYQIPEYPCGLTELTGCLKNAFVWTFYPSESSLQGISTLNDTLRTKAPFSFIYDFKDSISVMWQTSSVNDFGLTIDIFGGTFTFISKSMLAAVPFAATIRLILSYALWLMLAFTLYRMTLKLFDNNTQS